MRFPDDVPRLTDGEVTLRAHRREDVEAVVEQCNDAESVSWTTVPTPYSRADGVDWVEGRVPAGWAEETSLAFAIEVDGRFAGSVDLRPHGPAEAEVGYGLHPAARGRGVMRRALDLVLDWGFQERGLTAVVWRAQVGNWASRRVAWATGFHFGPTVPRLLDQRGTRHDAWTGWIGADDTRRPKNRWLEVPPMRTEHLHLRAWREDDAACLVEASNDPRLRRYIPRSPLPRTHEQVPAYLLRVHQAAADGTRLAWCVADRHTDEAMGNVALFDFEPDGSAQLGYWANPKARGRGTLSEAARLVADWALGCRPEGFGLRRLYLLSAVSNAASRRVAEQAGFTQVGTERQSAPAGHGYEDSALYDRLAEPAH